MDVLDALDRLRSNPWIGEGGDPKSVVFHPGLKESEVDAFEARLGVPLPLDYRRLLLVCREIEGLAVELDFTSASLFYGNEGLVSHGVPFAHDGFGNHWVVDCLAHPEERAAIFYDCHDAPVFLYQGNGMAEFLLDLIILETEEGRSTNDAVHEDRLFDVWGENPGTIARAEALASPDTSIRAFAEGLDDAFLLVDLRAVPVGMGFSWGRFGPETRLRRYREERLFAYAPPLRKPGLLSRLSGRGQGSVPFH